MDRSRRFQESDIRNRECFTRGSDGCKRIDKRSNNWRSQCIFTSNIWHKSETRANHYEGPRTVSGYSSRGLSIVIWKERDFWKWNENLYVQVLEAIYGMLISEILFYMYFRNYLASTGLESNPYNPCVANKLTHRGGTTVTIHVDYLKSITVDPRGNDDFIQFLYCKYRDLDIVKVKTTRGKIYNYLLIPLEYS